MAEMTEFHFAVGMLNGEIENKIDSKQIATRDFIFDQILYQFKDKPIRVFQVGAIETFRINWRIGSGWSDTLFGPHIKKHGGKLVIADISLDNLSHSIYAANSLGYEITPVYGDAIDYITEGEYDLYYLDGGNDPQETLDQFNLIKDRNAIVLIDDFSIKGTLIPKDLKSTVYDVANQVALIDLREGV